MIVTVEEVKQWLRVDHDEDDLFIQTLIKAAEEYLKNATGKEFNSENELARLFCLFLITDWYENREMTYKKVGEQVKYIIRAMISQLKYADGVDSNESS